MSTITIKSEKIKVGGKLRCIKELAVLFTPGYDYEILQIRDRDIMIVDNENDRDFPSCLSMDKNGTPNIFDYFQIW